MIFLFQLEKAKYIIIGAVMKAAFALKREVKINKSINIILNIIFLCFRYIGNSPLINNINVARKKSL